MSEFAIVAQQLSKSFPIERDFLGRQSAEKTKVVENVSLEVRDGELFGLLGPNGAGKTTLVKMLATLIKPTSGVANVTGYNLTDDVAQIRRRVGMVVTDERSLYWRLTARQNLRFFAAMHGMTNKQGAQRADELLADVMLTQHANTRFMKFSTGMKQRLAIARGLIHRPQLLFLDEPSRSLDPTSTQNLHDLILKLMAQTGMTVFLITHDLGEAEKLCTRVAVMSKGHVQAVGSSAELRKQLQPHRNYTLFVDQMPAEAVEPIERLVSNVDIGPHRLSFAASEDGPELTQLLDYLRTHNVRIRSIDGQPPSLEDVFTKLTE